MQLGLFRAAVPDRDLDQEVRRRCFRVLDKDVEIAVLAENSGVDQFIFKILARSAPVCLNQISVG